jgi:hypothetical protein
VDKTGIINNDITALNRPADMVYGNEAFTIHYIHDFAEIVAVGAFLPGAIFLQFAGIHQSGLDF